MANTFDAFPLGYFDRIKQAVRDTLRGDETLAAWCDGRIFLAGYSRVRKIRDEVPINLPAVLISGISEDWNPQVGSLQDIPVSIGITLVWEQYLDVDVEDAGISHSSAINHVASVLATNDYLQTPPGRGARLVTRRRGFEVPSLEYEEDAEYDAGGMVTGVKSTIVHCDIVAHYEAEIDYETWQLRA